MQVNFVVLVYIFPLLLNASIILMENSHPENFPFLDL